MIISHGTAPDHHCGTIDPDPGRLMTNRSARETLRHQATDLDASTILAHIKGRIDLWAFMVVMPGDGHRSSGHHATGVPSIQTASGLQGSGGGGVRGHVVSGDEIHDDLNVGYESGHRGVRSERDAKSPSTRAVACSDKKDP